ncbi:hypothetical protein C8R43DRAFT_344964 [Mycena crocata]|nr:hypothetical protein C8R43DRAFT_344964 [Mycena crocata]
MYIFTQGCTDVCLPCPAMTSTQRTSTFLRFLTSPPPPGVRTIPCTGLDIALRDGTITTGFVIEAQLDPKKLQHTFWVLVESKFPRAGARLARRNGVYEFQIPLVFDADSPPIAFTVADHSTEPYSSANRPALPIHLYSSDATVPSIQRVPKLDRYLKSRQCPTTLAQFLVRNTPLIHVHVAVYKNLTFIGLTSTHLTFDILGVRTLLHAWTRVLNGDDMSTIRGMAWDAAPFASFTANTEGLVLGEVHGWFDLGFLSRLRFAVPLLLHSLWDPAEARLVHVPNFFLEAHKQEIMQKLKRQGSNQWVGSSDVLMAWWLKTEYSICRSTDNTPIHIHITVDLRDKSLFPGASNISDIPYLHNAFLTIPLPPITTNAFRAESLADLALRIRRAILAFDADTDAVIAELKRRCTKPHKMLFPCPPGAEYLIQTNWRKARLEELDLSGASVGQTSQNKLRPRVMSFWRLESKLPTRGAGGITAEDEDAVWMTQIRGKGEWERLRRSGSVAFI